MGLRGRLRVVQINCQKSASVSQQLYQKVREAAIDVFLMQEPYTVGGRVAGFGPPFRILAGPGTDTPWSAIVICNPELGVLQLPQFSDQYMVCAQIHGDFGNLYVITLYCRYSISNESFLYRLDQVLRALRGKPVLIGTDANARSPLWFSDESDDPGQRLEDFIFEHRLQVINEVSPYYTFSSHAGESNIDVTVVSSAAIRLNWSWHIQPEWCFSDHRCIVLDANDYDKSRRLAGLDHFLIKKANWEVFDARIKEAFKKENSQNS